MNEQVEYQWRTVMSLAADAPSGGMIVEEALEMAALLLKKNISYGNSAMEPVRVFSKADTVEQLLVRIDDKLSRIQRGGKYFDEDTIADLVGYLLLLKATMKAATR